MTAWPRPSISMAVGGQHMHVSTVDYYTHSESTAATASTVAHQQLIGLTDPFVCRWQSPSGAECSVKLSSGEELSAHLRLHVIEGEQCCWKQCQYMSPDQVRRCRTETGKTFEVVRQAVASLINLHMLNGIEWYLINTRIFCHFQDSLTRHILFHAYIAHLKHQGALCQSKHQLPSCQLEEEEDEEVTVEVMVCLWCEKGVECGRGFDCVLEYHRHVCEHVTAMQEYKCCWRGTLYSMDWSQ